MIAIPKPSLQALESIAEEVHKTLAKEVGMGTFDSSRKTRQMTQQANLPAFIGHSASNPCGLDSRLHVCLWFTACSKAEIKQ
jgi:hypothetical protein